VQINYPLEIISEENHYAFKIALFFFPKRLSEQFFIK